MLNVLIALLLVANGGYWFWSQDRLATLGWPAPDPQPGAAKPDIPVDPQRIRPETAQEALAPMPADPVQAIDTPAAPVQWACWRLGPFSPGSQTQLQRALPLNSDDLRWAVLETTLPQRWVVVSERALDAQGLSALIQQARSGGVDYRTSETDVLRGRLILGTFLNRDTAQSALEDLQRQGWTPLSVVRERPPMPALMLQTHVAMPQALTRAQQAVAKIPVLGQTSLQTLPCDEPAPNPPTPTLAPPADQPPSTATSAGN